MTPKEKAKVLVFDFMIIVKYLYEAKKCALKTVEEILNTCVESMIYYWVEVKQEIEAL